MAEDFGNSISMRKGNSNAPASLTCLTSLAGSSSIVWGGALDGDQRRASVAGSSAATRGSFPSPIQLGKTLKDNTAGRLELAGRRAGGLSRQPQKVRPFGWSCQSTRPQAPLGARNRSTMTRATAAPAMHNRAAIAAAEKARRPPKRMATGAVVASAAATTAPSSATRTATPRFRRLHSQVAIPTRFQSGGGSARGGLVNCNRLNVAVTNPRISPRMRNNGSKRSR